MSDLFYLRGPRGGYWRPGGQGYTTDISEAGTFNLDYATEAVANAQGVSMERVPQPEEGSYIYPGVLKRALQLAIEKEAADGRTLGHLEPSGYQLALQANLDYLMLNHTLEVRQP